MPVQNTETAISILYIMGIFPGAFISRKMAILTFSRVFFSWPTHGCIDPKFSGKATKRSGC